MVCSVCLRDVTTFECRVGLVDPHGVTRVPHDVHKKSSCRASNPHVFGDWKKKDCQCLQNSKHPVSHAFLVNAVLVCSAHGPRNAANQDDVQREPQWPSRPF